MAGKYVTCDERDVPGTVRFDVPGRNQGQTVEVAYGGWDRGEHDRGDPYRRTIDRSVGPTPVYARWVLTAG